MAWNGIKSSQHTGMITIKIEVVEKSQQRLLDDMHENKFLQITVIHQGL